MKLIIEGIIEYSEMLQYLPVTRTILREMEKTYHRHKFFNCPLECYSRLITQYTRDSLIRSYIRILKRSKV